MASLKGHHMRVSPIIFTLLLILSVSVHAQGPLKQKTQQRTSTQRRSLSPGEIARKALPSVVEIVSKDAEGRPIASGSGFFVDGGWLIATNYHVVEGASSIAVRIIGWSRAFQWEVGWIDEKNDLALLKLPEVPESPSPPKEVLTEDDIRGVMKLPLPIGNSNSVKVGDEIFAIGNPKGFEGTFSQGIVSALRGEDFIQITAPISEGSSGGPVLNKRGEVIGVATLFVKEGQNLNFAISSIHLKALLNKAGTKEGSKEHVIASERSTTGLEGKSAKALFDEGRRILDPSGGNRSEITATHARPYFEEALRKDPNYVEAWVGLGDCLFIFQSPSDEGYLKAADIYIQAIRVNPEYFEAHKRLGDLYSVQAGSLSESKPSEAALFYQKAASSYEHAVSIKPDDDQTLIWLGKALHRSGQRSKAERAFSKVRQLSNNKPEILRSLGWAYNYLELHQEAANVLTQYLRIKPDDHEGYTQLGEAYKGLGLSAPSRRLTDLYFQQALESFKKALGLATSELAEAIIRFDLGFLYLYMGDKSSALNEYKRLKDMESGKAFATILFNSIYK